MNPVKMADYAVIFGCDIKRLMPQVPSDFGHSLLHKRCINLIETWFYNGIDKSMFVPKPGIDRIDALRHLSTILQSFDLRHEDKIFGAAYLVSIWFEVKQS